MGGLALQEEQHRPTPPYVGGNSRKVGNNSNHNTSSIIVQDAAAAAVGGGLTPTPPLLQMPLVLPTATPERRRLAPTEFITLSSSTFAVSPPTDTGGGEIIKLSARVGEPDAVMAKLVRDFDNDDEQNGSACSPTPPNAACSSSSGDSVDVNESAPISSAAETEGVDDRRPATADSIVTVESSTERKHGEGASRRWNNRNRHPSSALGSSAAHGCGKPGEVFEGFHDDGADHDAGDGGGGDGDDGRNGDGVDGLEEEARRITRSTTEEEVDVPDGEWRRYRGVEKETQRGYCSGLR